MPTPLPFPHRYQVQLSARVDGRAVLGAADHPDIVGGAPPQFGGEPDSWSPEELLLSAVNLCLMKSFDWLAERAQLKLASYRSDCEGVLEKSRDGIVFSAIVASIHLVVTDPAQVEEARRMMEKAKRYCIVSSSLKVPVELRIGVELQASPAS